MQNNSKPQAIFTINEQHSAPSWVSVKSRIIRQQGWLQIVIGITGQRLIFDAVSGPSALWLQTSQL